MNDTDILFDFENSKSIKIFPRGDRRKMEKITSYQENMSRKALDSAEKELQYMMDVANRRIEKLRDIVKENIKSGVHLESDPFIPEYLGFTELLLDKGVNDLRMYAKDGYSIARKGDQWIVLYPDKKETIVPIKNMYMAIKILSSCGVDVNFEDYMDGKYSQEKSLEEIVDESIQKVIKETRK